MEQMDQSGTNKGCAFPCMGKQTGTLGKNNALGTDPCFGGQGAETPAGSVEPEED